MDPTPVEYGVGIAVAVYLIKTVLDYALKLTDKIKKKNGNGGAAPRVDTGTYPPVSPVTAQNLSDIFKFLGETRKLAQDLHDWHDVRDEDHVFAWYVRKSLAVSIENLNKTVADLATAAAKQNELLRHLTEEDSDG